MIPTKSAGVLFLLVTFLFSGCMSSDVIMTGSAHTAIKPEEVQIYIRPPATFESVGLISVSANNSPSRSHNKKRAIEELKNKAAALGANGIILKDDGSTTSSTSAVYVPNGTGGGVFVGGKGPVVEMSGEAIFVKL